MLVCSGLWAVWILQPHDWHLLTQVNAAVYNVLWISWHLFSVKICCSAVCDETQNMNETESETLFRYQIFRYWIWHFFDTKFYRYRIWYDTIPNKWEFFETEKFRNRIVKLCCSVHNFCESLTWHLFPVRRMGRTWCARMARSLSATSVALLTIC